MKSFPIVHPHRLLSCLFDYVGLQIAQSEVRQYWTHARSMGEEWALEHPASWDHIPVGIHGDAAKLWTQYKFEKVVAIWMNVILFRPSSVRHSRFLLFSCPHALMVKNRTLNRVFRRLVWSFNAAFEGINPTVGEGGRALTGNDLLRAGSPITSSNHRFALCELRGNWEYHRDVFRFTASWQGIDMCFRCPAKSKGAARDLYHNLGPDCAWVHEEFNLAQFISRRLKDRHLSILIVFSELLMVFVQGLETMNLKKKGWRGIQRLVLPTRWCSDIKKEMNKNMLRSEENKAKEIYVRRISLWRDCPINTLLGVTRILYMHILSYLRIWVLRSWNWCYL